MGADQAIGLSLTTELTVMYHYQRKADQLQYPPHGDKQHQLDIVKPVKFFNQLIIYVSSKTWSCSTACCARLIGAIAPTTKTHDIKCGNLKYTSESLTICAVVMYSQQVQVHAALAPKSFPTP